MSDQCLIRQTRVRLLAIVTLAWLLSKLTLDIASRGFTLVILLSIFKVIWSEVGVRKLLKKDPKVSRDYLEIETDAQSLLRIIIMKVFRRDLQRIFLGMKDIPTRDVSAFTMVRNLIIGSGKADSGSFS